MGKVRELCYAGREYQQNLVKNMWRLQTRYSPANQKEEDVEDNTVYLNGWISVIGSPNSRSYPAQEARPARRSVIS